MAPAIDRCVVSPSSNLPLCVQPPRIEVPCGLVVLGGGGVGYFCFGVIVFYSSAGVLLKHPALLRSRRDLRRVRTCRCRLGDPPRTNISPCKEKDPCPIFPRLSG